MGAAGHATMYTTWMRAALLAFGLAGCWTGAQTEQVPHPVPRIGSCNDAALGIDRSTKDLRVGEAPVVGPLRTRCTEDKWSVEAIDCFMHMGTDDLGKCAGMIGDGPREKLFAVLGSGGSSGDRAELAMAVAKLQNLRVGIPECDNFVIAVARILACNEMPLGARVQLGNETVDFWSLPTSGRLPADAIKRMATVCDQTRGELEQRAVGAGCKL